MKSHFIVFFFLIFFFTSVSAQKVGLVLSGGGARGLAHIGVLRALEENNIPIDYITGTSIGALVGGLYSIGYSPDEIEVLVSSDDFLEHANGIINDDLSYFFKKKNDNASWITLPFSTKTGWQASIPMNIINPVPLDFAIMEYTGAAAAKSNYNFDSLFIPFRCVAADIETKRSVIFRNGDLGEAIRASFAFPFYFPPVNYDGKILYDGGLYNNFPVDVMKEEFAPDYIIGVDVSGGNTIISDNDNILQQIRTMIVQRNVETLKPGEGIIIEPNVQAGLLDFEDVRPVVYEGYRAAMAKMNEIIRSTPSMVNKTTVTKHRTEYNNDKSELMISNIAVTGLAPGQAQYIHKILLPENKPIAWSKLKKRYFRMIADDNIKKIFPRLSFDKNTGQYTLNLNIKRENDIIAQFGGNVASRPINEGFLNIQHNFWGSQSLSLNGNIYFGKLYSSAQISGRLDVPGRIPFFFEPMITRNSWDFFKSSSTFFEDVKPSYLVQSDWQYILRLGVPVRNKGRLTCGGSVIQLIDDYYQTDKFTKADTADRTRFNGENTFIEYERSTLNRKIYANSGTYLNLRLKFITGNEFTEPGSTAIIKTDTEQSHDWWNFRFVWDDYFKRRGNLRFGFYSEVNFSNQPLFNNYTSTLLTSPAFQPTPETKTLFLKSFHSHNYSAFGLKNIIAWKKNIEFRLEGYVFQPYEEILENTDFSASYSAPFNRRFFIATAGAVVYSPVGPLSLSVNYYQDRNKIFEKSLGILFHFGFIIFNKSATE